jgi:nicotinamidase-related amidase
VAPRLRPAKNSDLHGNAPDEARAALLLIDVINDLEFEGGAELLVQALPMAARLAALKRRAKALGLPAVYVNDNFGRWQSDFAKLVRHCLETDVRGRPLAERLQPDDDDYFVLKPKHSGFFSTVLDTLLEYLQADTLILTGLTTESCVLLTAADAHMRDFHVIVPADCVASADPRAHERSLDHLRDVLKVHVAPSTTLDLEGLASPVIPGIHGNPLRP